MTTTLEIAPEPRSVRAARAWVVTALQELGRADLADAAELGVSELVTNAILHADPPIVVRVGGTPAHPRVEVHDTSAVPPRPRDMNDEERLLATVGRGLGIVSMYSSTWGAEVSTQGKVVWFEPVAEPSEGPLDAEVFDFGEIVASRLAATEDPVERVTIRLLGFPPLPFARFRLWYEELRRELRLLALTHGGDYPLATELSDLALEVEQQRRQSLGVEELERAMAAGLDRVDLEYAVPLAAPATMARLLEQFEQVDRFCHDQRLLTAEPTGQLLALRTWYLTEFVRQGRGEAPLPWPGSTTVEDPLT